MHAPAAARRRCSWTPTPSWTPEFVGIDIRDNEPGAPIAFEREFGVEYPSIYDPGSEQLLRFGAKYASKATPSTYVLDREGRVAALISGEVPSLGHAARRGRGGRGRGWVTGSRARPAPGRWRSRIPVALVAGLVSFFSPCVIPLLPGYLSYATGLSGADLAVG